MIFFLLLLLNSLTLNWDTQRLPQEFSAIIVDTETIKPVYNLTYWLSHLIVEADGSSEYLGRAQFESFEGAVETYAKNRKQTYFRGTRHFLKSLINNQIEENGFSISSGNIVGDQFERYKGRTKAYVLVLDTLSGYYHLRFPDFLQVTNRNFQILEKSKLDVKIDGLENTKFNNTSGGSKVKSIPSSSYIYKISQSLVIDKYGTVLNPKRMQEYGAWAHQRVALMLPIDFISSQNHYENLDSIEEDEEMIPQKIEILDLLSNDVEVRKNTAYLINKNWNQAYAPQIIDLLRFVTDKKNSREYVRILELNTGAKLGYNFYDWKQYLWDQDPVYDQDYFSFKSSLYKELDPKFEQYFTTTPEFTKIRLDEVLWGGVAQDGIPPLRHPEMIGAIDANYLDNEDIVFGMVINGIPKAYPKRILAWHEFVVDTYDDTEVNGVYCTLCGTMIAYNSKWEDRHFQLGTSGFLYRSNKLMYDKGTQSLWNTITGEPVIGPLVNQKIQLETFPVITTTWGKWKKQYPLTQVLSLNTGHIRNYDEGEAYKNYFNTDELMFPVPNSDNRLKNKDEVFVIKQDGYEKDPIAISVAHINKKRLLELVQNGKSIVVISTNTGIKTYESQSITFKKLKKNQLIDNMQNKWIIHDDGLKAEHGKFLKRLAGHRIFWFAWANIYPEGRLIK